MSAFENRAKAFRHRNEIPVSLRLVGSDVCVDATVFTTLNERASDLLNDNRDFIPVKMNGGDTQIIAKKQIASLIEKSVAKEEDPEPKTKASEEPSSKQEKSKPAEPKVESTFDPYAMLRVSPDASIEEIRSAYKARIKTVHPDAIASLGLDEDISKAAVLATQKVNYAYQRILRDRDLRNKKVA